MQGLATVGPDRPALAIGLWRRLEVPGRTLPLRLAFAEPAAAPRATLVILPGRAEFIEKYEEIIDDLCALGFAVAMVEWRGQGLSRHDDPWRGRGHVDDIGHYLEDLDDALRALAAHGVPQPLVMLGHSMGGHVGLRWLRDAPGSFAAAAMTSPMFGIALRRVPLPLARILGRVAVAIGAGRRYAPGQRDFHPSQCRYANNPLTACPAQFARFAELLAMRPELGLGGVTWGWLDAALRSIALTGRSGFAEAVATPVLLCLAEEERIVCNRSIERFAARLPAARLRRFDGRHELLIEREPLRRAVLAEIDRFFAEAAGV